MQMWLKVFTEKHNTSFSSLSNMSNGPRSADHYMWSFIADLSAVINTEWAEKKIKTVPHSAKSIETRTNSEQLSKT